MESNIFVNVNIQVRNFIKNNQTNRELIIRPPTTTQTHTTKVAINHKLALSKKEKSMNIKLILKSKRRTKITYDNNNKYHKEP